MSFSSVTCSIQTFKEIVDLVCQNLLCFMYQNSMVTKVHSWVPDFHIIKVTDCSILCWAHPPDFKSDFSQITTPIPKIIFLTIMELEGPLFRSKQWWQIHYNWVEFHPQVNQKSKALYIIYRLCRSYRKWVLHCLYSLAYIVASLLKSVPFSQMWSKKLHAMHL